MRKTSGLQRTIATATLLGIWLPAGIMAQDDACRTLVDAAALNVTRAEIVPAASDTPAYCYVRGTATRNIRYHMQLPLADNWNGRLLHWGDGLKDGDLDFADHRLAEGYAVVNSNTGHDAGAEPGASFGWNDRAAELDFGYRAVHLTVKAARSLVELYYGQGPSYAYHEGCSTGGRQGLMAAQRYPDDFDGIVAGAPVNYYQELNMSHVWMLQRVFEDDFAGVPGFDTNGDGKIDSFRKLEIVHERVITMCDALDGVEDGIVDDPRACDLDLADMVCSENSDTCLTLAQAQLIKDFYRGAYDDNGVSVLKGLPAGSELRWTRYFPSAENDMFPLSLHNAGNHGAYLFYEQDPGVPVPNPADTDHPVARDGVIPEWAWWEFDINDVTSGKGDFMKRITNAVDPDLRRFLKDRGGKLLLWHGWQDVGAHPEPTLDYYEQVVSATYGGDIDEARSDARLFMFPGMGHCGGGDGPNEWDPLTPLVAWTEKGIAPDHVVAWHRGDAGIDNERKVCAFPERTAYAGPERDRHVSRGWKEENFVCRLD